MARENNAAVSRSCGWCWYRSVHCVRVNSHLILVRSLDIFSRCDRFIGLGPGGLGVIEVTQSTSWVLVGAKPKTTSVRISQDIVLAECCKILLSG